MPLDIFTRIDQNDRSLLKELYENNYYKARRYVLRNNGTEEDAKDVFHEGIIALWHNVREKKFMPQNQNEVEAYLFTIIKNKWVDMLRARKRQMDKKDELKIHTELVKFDGDEKEKNIQKVTAAVHRLGEPCNQILQMFYYQKKTYDKISEELPYDKETLKTMKYRCMNKLRKLIAEKVV